MKKVTCILMSGALLSLSEPSCYKSNDGTHSEPERDSQSHDAPSESESNTQTDAQSELDLDSITLGHKMKGWELYGWTDADGEHFTLIYGSNRTKTHEEVTSDENLFEDDSGWMKITVSEIEDLETLISKVPKGDSISWRGCGFEGCKTVSRDTEDHILALMERLT